MQRTSLYLLQSLHYQLRMVSKAERKSVSALIVDLVDKALATQEKAHLDRMYTELGKLDDVAVKGVDSASIDEILYGDGQHAAWRGNGAGEE